MQRQRRTKKDSCCRKAFIWRRQGWPSFETPAEIRAFHALGATCWLAWSTVPETIVARHMGIEVLGISCVTNLAAGLGTKPLSHEEVNETGRWVESRLASLLSSSACAEDCRKGWKTRRERGNDQDGAPSVSTYCAGDCRLLSGSGKTTLANELARALRGLRFHLDDYYLDLADLPLAERVKQNFDDPALIEVPLLARDVAALARGESIDRPIYDFATYTRVPGQSQRVTAGPFLIVEGPFALHYRELLPYYNLRVYVGMRQILYVSSGG